LTNSIDPTAQKAIVSTGAPYTNRYISVLTITDRKVTHWRDYLDPVAVFRRARMAVTLMGQPLAALERGTRQFPCAGVTIPAL
jgi:hypothetical protein